MSAELSKARQKEADAVILRWLYRFSALPVSVFQALLPDLTERQVRRAIFRLTKVAGVVVSSDYVYATAGITDSDRILDAVWVLLRLGSTDPDMIMIDDYPAQATFILYEKAYQIIVLREGEYWALNLIPHRNEDDLKYIIVVPDRETAIGLKPPGEKYIFAVLDYKNGPLEQPEIGFFSDPAALFAEDPGGIEPKLRTAFQTASDLLDEVNEQFDLAEEALAVKDSKALNHFLTEVELRAEKLVMQTRQLPVYINGAVGRNTVRSIIQKSIPVTLGFTQQGWFSVRFPMLMPHKSKGNVNYIRGFLWDAMSDFFSDRDTLRIDPAVLIFRHCYDRERSKRGWRDHDNMEVSIAADIVAEYLMITDHPSHCSNYETSAGSAYERTEVYVIPKSEFPCWLELEPSFPDEGITLYKEMPAAAEQKLCNNSP